MLKRLVSKNGRILRENKRPEIFAKDGRFPAESGGLESQYETCTLSFVYERADAILKMERNLFEQTISNMRKDAQVDSCTGLDGRKMRIFYRILQAEPLISFCFIFYYGNKAYIP